MQYFYDPMRVWRLRENRTSPVCIRYRHSGSAPGEIVWTAIGQTIRLSPALIKGNLKADRYTSGILPPVLVPYLRCLPNAIFQQDDVRPNVAILSLSNVKQVIFL